LVTGGFPMAQAFGRSSPRHCGIGLTQPSLLRPWLPTSFAITALITLTSACGSTSTGFDERCAELAATGYTEVKQMQELLQLAHQTTDGSATSIRQRTMAFCVKEAS
jgi:hypothetical protein